MKLMLLLHPIPGSPHFWAPMEQTEEYFTLCAKGKNLSQTGVPDTLQVPSHFLSYWFTYCWGSGPPGRKVRGPRKTPMQISSGQGLPTSGAWPQIHSLTASSRDHYSEVGESWGTVVQKYMVLYDPEKGPYSLF